MTNATKFTAAIAIAALLLTTAAAQAATWDVTSSTVTFTVMNAGNPVSGTLSGLKAQINFDPAALEKSRIIATVETATVKTGIALRDRHLRSEDYFYAVMYPQISIDCDRFDRLGESRYQGACEVTMRGKKKRIDVPFTFLRNDETGTFSGEIVLDRTEFGVGGRSRFVANEAKVNVEVTVKRGSGQ